MLTNECVDEAERESRRRAAELFAELASGSTNFSAVVSTRYAEWRNLFRVLKELRDDETSALRGCAADGSAPTDFESWGRERTPMFADEFGKFLRHEGCVAAVEVDLGCEASAGARAKSVETPAGKGGGTPVGRHATNGAAMDSGVVEVEKSFRRMKTPSRASEALETDYARDKPAARTGLGGAARVAVAPEPTNGTPQMRAQAAQKSPPPTPRPAQLSPPANEYADHAATTPQPSVASNKAHVEHLMSYLTGFHGLLFGLKDHVERIRGATIENVAHELARTDARLDTAIARLEAAMGVESGKHPN